MKGIKKVVSVEFTISGKVYALFMEWIKNTKFSKQKIKIMNLLKNGEIVSLQDLSDKTKMSLPLINYHIHGNLKNEGLIEAEFITSENISRGRIGVKISEFGLEILNAINENVFSGDL